MTYKKSFQPFILTCSLRGWLRDTILESWSFNGNPETRRIPRPWPPVSWSTLPSLLSDSWGTWMWIASFTALLNFMFSTISMLTLSILTSWSGRSMFTCCATSDVTLLHLLCSWKHVLRDRSVSYVQGITGLTLNVIDWAYHFLLHLIIVERLFSKSNFNMR